MDASIKKEITNVLNHYNLNVKSVKTESYKVKKGVWWIETSTDTKILKMHSYNKGIIEFILKASVHLRNNGVNIPEIIPTKDNKSYVNVNEHYFILSEAIEGKKFNYVNEAEIEAMIKSLANFHKASLGFKINECDNYRTHIGKWVQKRKSKIEKLIVYYTNIDKEKFTKFDSLILSEFRHFYNRAINSISEIDSSDYYKYNNIISKNGGLCHQDFAAGNLIKTPNNKIYIIDMDSITVDIPLRDIRKLLNKIMKKKGHWDIDLTGKIIYWYNCVNPLEKWQWRLLKSTLLYPHLFIGIMSKYYEKREKTWNETKYLKKLQDIIKLEHSLEKIINSIEDIFPE
ncbi:CotS family spore coat protein [Abyssisolibacter fermentans]|uniref:CotS family spore coat protein n=1 Tax=Abyssisolibacter fermentans TaxID=1766203 RepID=UPI00082FA5D1|nr:CotS family spore coat protein [Abyssisolibacter fermentans]